MKHHSLISLQSNLYREYLVFTNCFGGTLKRKCDFIVTCEHLEMDSVHQLNAYPSVTSSINMNIFTLMTQMSRQILTEQGLGYNIWKYNRIYTVKNVSFFRKKRECHGYSQL